MPFYPGPGIGGHCIPLDPHYLSWKARQHGFDSQFISLGRTGQFEYAGIRRRTCFERSKRKRKAVNGSKILILGVAYKKDIDDMRESPALSIIDLLRADGADVYYHDPFVAEVTFDHAYTIGDGEPLYNKELTDDLISGLGLRHNLHRTFAGRLRPRVCEARIVVDTQNASFASKYGERRNVRL